MYEHWDVSQRLTFEFLKIDADLYPSITKAVIKQFLLEPVGELLICLDELFQDYQHDGKIVGLEWDNWSGYSVVAKTESAEEMVREIAVYINARFQQTFG